MRIVGGRMRGLRLADPGAGDVEARLRPTTDRVREAIFNLLVNGSHGNPLPKARVLDLFAGTGALGLEALSRGAAHVTFVDDGAVALSLIRRNIELARCGVQVAVLRRDATRLGPHLAARFDLVFMDPPYGQSRGEAALSSALRGGWLTDQAVLVWEEAQPPLLPEGWHLLERRNYGNTVVTMARRIVPI